MNKSVAQNRWCLDRAKCSKLVRVSLGALALAATLTFGTRDAKATVWTTTDNFNGAAWNYWSSNPTDSYGGTGWSNNDHTSGAGYDGFMYFWTPAAASDWSQLWQVYQAPTNNPIVNCAARIWLEPGNAARGSLDLINPSNWTYIGSQPFSFSGTNNVWYPVTVSATYPCTSRVVVRVVLSGGGNQYVEIDDMSLSWLTR
jgi:hypothetical protein